MRIDVSKAAAQQLDRLVADSKQITADLMAVRREVKRFIARKPPRVVYSAPEDRIYLVLAEVRALASEISLLWNDCIGIPKDQPKTANRGTEPTPDESEAAQ